MVESGSLWLLAMTEFRQTTEELASLEALLSLLSSDVSTPVPEKLQKFASAKASKKVKRNRQFITPHLNVQ